MQIIQVAQHAEDLERAGRFYAGLLGQEPAATFDPPGLIFFVVGSVRLLLERGAPSSLIYLAVPDVRSTVDGLRRDSVEILAEPTVIFRHEDGRLGPAGMNEWMAFIRDSEGNTVGLVCHSPSDL